LNILVTTDEDEGDYFVVASGSCIERASNTARVQIVDAIPAASSWGLLVLGVLMLTAGTLMIKARSSNIAFAES
jgi:hypothetical protein